jgi:hypothetical protein
MEHFIRTHLHRLTGLENHDITSLLIHHAKSNDFQAAVARHYRLDRWVQNFDYRGDRVVRKTAGAREDTARNETDVVQWGKAWADVLEVWIGMVERERVLWWERDTASELHEWLEYILAVRYARFLEQYIDFGVYHMGEMAQKVKFSEKELWHPSGETQETLAVGTRARQNQKRLGFLVEARFAEERGKETRRRERPRDRMDRIRRKEMTEELVGRAFSGNAKVAKKRAQEKLLQRMFFSLVDRPN